MQALQRNKEEQLQLRQMALQNMRINQPQGPPPGPPPQILPLPQQSTPSQASATQQVCQI